MFNIYQHISVQQKCLNNKNLRVHTLTVGFITIHDTSKNSSGATPMKIS